MYQQVNEPISVLALFQKGKISPIYFKWGQKKYQVKTINLTHSKNQGSSKIWYFSVTCFQETFLISYNTTNYNWHLDQIYQDG